jgi:hypothetical protein
VSRVEIIGDATLYLGDCRDILPTLRRYERALEAIVEMSGDQPARTAWNMVHLARAALSAARGTDSPQAEAVKE